MAGNKSSKSSEKTGAAEQPVRTAKQLREAPLTVANGTPMEFETGKPGPPVVGIGASAGGLDAFKHFFTAMPADSGVGFVLIPHLDPKHQSLMVELIARYTKMPVVEAADGMPVEANRVYIIPPNKYMTFRSGVLQLTGPVERTGPQTSIDLFLRSLADDKQEKAICIILSGTGAHGTLGLKAIKAANGMAMVQDPNTAEYPRMPENAIATGLADYILPVKRMPEALIKYIEFYHVNGSKTGVEAQNDLDKVLGLLRTRMRFDFRCYRVRMLTRRIERRMSLLHLDKIADYLDYLREHPDEVKQLFRDLLISVTNFFRDPEAFQALETEVVAPLVRVKEFDAPFRIWSAGCATGEEPYSLGIMLLEQLAAEKKSCKVQIFATDVDEAALEAGRHGVYPDTISTDVSLERLGRYFTRKDDSSFQVTEKLRELVVFARQNLITDAPFSKLDLIVCRNLLIYLEPEIQKKIIALLHFSLNEGGYLFLGPAETLGRHTELFEPVSKKWRIFRRTGPVRLERVEVPIANTTDRLLPVRRLEPPTANRPVSFADMTHRLLLDQFAPAAVMINRKYEILYFFGPTDRYLATPAGEPTHDLMMIAREGLRTKLRSAIHKAVRENNLVTLADVQVKRNGELHSAILTIRPVQGQQGENGLLLVTFQDSDQVSAPVRPPDSPAEESLVRQLECELKITREDLQSTIEELESSNEELKVSNEEVMSMNEELQSTNEELETSKEELQSLNEELTTVNNQLQDKLGDLETANNDMANLLNCTEVAIIFLDSEFRIKRFTRPAMRLFNLIATDLDRPIGDITPKFTESTLREDVEQVLRNLALQEKQVQTSDGCWRSRRITPYRTRDDHIEGVVLTFTDVTQVRHAAEQTKRLAGVLRDSNNRDAVSDGNEFDRSPLDVLTDRELTVFRLIGAGVKTSEMAKRLHLSVKTIETYRDRVRRKLKFENSTELSHYAAQWALASNSSSLE
jgi:two-component system CheB/CheR fusion protein